MKTTYVITFAALIAGAGWCAAAETAIFDRNGRMTSMFYSGEESAFAAACRFPRAMGAERLSRRLRRAGAAGRERRASSPPKGAPRACGRQSRKRVGGPGSIWKSRRTPTSISQAFITPWICPKPSFQAARQICGQHPGGVGFSARSQAHYPGVLHWNRFGDCVHGRARAEIHDQPGPARGRSRWGTGGTVWAAGCTPPPSRCMRDGWRLRRPRR